MNFSNVLTYAHQLNPAQRIKSLLKLQNALLQIHNKIEDAVKLLYEFIMNNAELQRVYEKSFF